MNHIINKLKTIEIKLTVFDTIKTGLSKFGSFFF